jgi:hypothetical protein
MGASSCVTVRRWFLLERHRCRRVWRKAFGKATLQGNMAISTRGATPQCKTGPRDERCRGGNMIVVTREGG